MTGSVNPFQVVFEVASFAQGIDAAMAAKKATKLRRRITQIQNVQRRQQFLRNFYMTQAQALDLGNIAGFESSMALAQQANVETQGRRAIRQANRIEQLDTKAFEAERKAARHSSISSGLGSLGDIAGGLG